MLSTTQQLWLTTAIITCAFQSVPAFSTETAVAAGDPSPVTTAVKPEPASNQYDAGAPVLETIPVATQVDSDTPNDQPRTRSRLMEEVIVTAQKREQAIQDVPISIAAFTADQLDAQGVATADGLARITPGLTFTKVGGFSLVYLRGIGTEAFLPGADQTVPQYIDGVNIIGSQGSQYELGRVQRIEILKGPQGTLFGRNSTGGAINIITPAPSNVFEGDAELDVGNYGALNTKAFVNIPISDNLGAAISAYSNSHDEYYVNESGNIFDRTYQRGAQAKVRWQLVDNFALTLFGNAVKSKVSDSLVTENTDPTPILGALIPPDELDRVAHNDVIGGSRTRQYLISGTAEWGLEWIDTKAIVSNQRYESPFNSYDFDSSALPLVSFQVPRQFAKQTTAELQFLSNTETPFGDVFEWVAGLYYLNGLGGFQQLNLQIAESGLLTALGPTGTNLQSLFNRQLEALGLPGLLTGAVNATAAGLIASKSLSVYFQGTYHFTDTLNLTLGARYQKEERGIRNSHLGLLNPVNGDEYTALSFNPPDLTANQLAPRVALQWKFADNTQFYGSWARGFQSPTYNAINFFTAPDPVKEVKVDSYELGAKSILFDNTLQFDTAVFLTKEKNVTNAFVSLSSGGVVRFDNVGAAEIYGAEFSGTWTPLRNIDPGLAVTGGATYLHAEYTDFTTGRGFDETTGLAFGPGLLTPLPERDFTGNRITRTPKLTYSLGVNQLIPLESGSVEIGADAFYNSGFFFLPQNSDRYSQGAYTLYNARVSYTYAPWDVQITAYCVNLTDAKYIDSQFPTDFGRGDHLGIPRLYGLKAKWTF